MKRSLVLIALAAVFTTPCQAESSDDTLQFYLSKSDLVVIGEIKSEVFGVENEAGVPNYICDFAVKDVLKGDAIAKGKTMRVNIMRFESVEKDHHPLIKKDGECILFLKQQSESTIPRWSTADFWFGVQHPFPWMARSIKRLTGTR